MLFFKNVCVAYCHGMDTYYRVSEIGAVFAVMMMSIVLLDNIFSIYKRSLFFMSILNTKYIFFLFFCFFLSFFSA